MTNSERELLIFLAETVFNNQRNFFIKYVTSVCKDNEPLDDSTAEETELLYRNLVSLKFLINAVSNRDETPLEEKFGEANEAVADTLHIGVDKLFSVFEVTHASSE